MFGSRYQSHINWAWRIAAAMMLAGIVVAATINGQSRQRTASPNPPAASGKPSGTKPADSEGEVVRVSSNLVVVPVSVTNAKGLSVDGLTAKDFRLEEEGREQPIARLGDPEQVPLELAILVDVSGSVKDRFTFEKDAAARFVRNILKPTDRAVLYAIDQTPRLEQSRTTADQIAAKLPGIEFTDLTTAFYDTVVEAAQYLMKSTPPQHRRVILVISDGEDTYSEKVRSIEDTISAVQRSDAIFYSINPSEGNTFTNFLGKRGQNEMQMLASATGGTAFAPDMIENLDSVFQQIATELRSQYLLEYYANSDAPAGSFLRIKVQVPDQTSLRIRARQGYYLVKKM